MIKTSIINKPNWNSQIFHLIMDRTYNLKEKKKVREREEKKGEREREEKKGNRRNRKGK